MVTKKTPAPVADNSPGARVYRKIMRAAPKSVLQNASKVMQTTARQLSARPGPKPAAGPGTVTRKHAFSVSAKLTEVQAEKWRRAGASKWLREQLDALPTPRARRK